ncbi:MAG: folate-binding protein [Hydrogenothermaceae bacterium]|nr:folate-binding protein [Hydrogenothermaceae bacterium]
MNIVQFKGRSKIKVFGKQSKLLNPKLSNAGNDQTVFLNGILTNDIKALENGSFNYNLMLNEKGYPIDDFFVYRLDDSFILDFEGDAQERVDRFSKLKLSLKVFFEVLELNHYYIFGNEAVEFLRERLNLETPLDNFRFSSTENETVVGKNPIRIGVDGYDIFTKADLSEYVNFSEIEFESLRIKNCVPKIGKELKEGIIPLETNIWKYAISFTKGCYTGQEVIARIRYRGKPPRSMVKFKMSDYIPEGSTIFSEDKKVGIITSSDRDSLESIGIVLNSYINVDRIYNCGEKELKLMCQCRELEIEKAEG